MLDFAEERRRRGPCIYKCVGVLQISINFFFQIGVRLLFGNVSSVTSDLRKTVIVVVGEFFYHFFEVHLKLASPQNFDRKSDIG